MNPDGTADSAAIVADYQWFRQHGGLTETVDLDAVLDERFAAHAVSLLGPYR